MAYKLLLADDSITIQKVVELTLSEEGFDVTAVGDGASALETAAKLVPDIVLADVFMPKMDGYELCSNIKSDARFSGVPVMLLAGTFEEFDEAKATAVGADDKLTKPFESAELIAKVKGLVENRPAPAAPVEAEPAAAVEAAVEAAAGPEPSFEAEAAQEANDLWSVVDMSSEEQPLAAATEVISEEDLWKRANLMSDTEEAAAAEEEGLPIEEFAAGEFEEAAEAPAEVFAEEPEEAAAEPYAEDFATFEEDADKTAVLNMDELQSSVYAEQAEDVAAIEVAEVTSEQEITSFESLGEATEAADYSPAPQPEEPAVSAAPAAVAGVSEEMIKTEIMKAAQSIIDAKMKEALSSMTGEMIERIVWEVVPELAEEIIQKEINKIKAGS